LVELIFFIWLGIFLNGLVASGVVKKINASSLEGGLVGGVELGVEAGFVLLREPVLGFVWRGESQNSWRGSLWDILFGDCHIN